MLPIFLESDVDVDVITKARISCFITTMGNGNGMGGACHEP